MTEPTETNVPKTSITPLSVATFGLLDVVISRHTQGEKSGVFVNIRRNGGGDPSTIPLADVPALIMMLTEIVKPGILVRSFTTSPAAPTKKPRKKK